MVNIYDIALEVIKHCPLTEFNKIWNYKFIYSDERGIEDIEIWEWLIDHYLDNDEAYTISYQSLQTLSVIQDCEENCRHFVSFDERFTEVDTSKLPQPDESLLLENKRQFNLNETVVIMAILYNELEILHYFALFGSLRVVFDDLIENTAYTGNHLSYNLLKKFIYIKLEEIKYTNYDFFNLEDTLEMELRYLCLQLTQNPDIIKYYLELSSYDATFNVLAMTNPIIRSDEILWELSKLDKYEDFKLIIPLYMSQPMKKWKKYVELVDIDEIFLVLLHTLPREIAAEQAKLIQNSISNEDLTLGTVLFINDQLFLDELMERQFDDDDFYDIILLRKIMLDPANISFYNKAIQSFDYDLLELLFLLPKDDDTIQNLIHRDELTNHLPILINRTQDEKLLLQLRLIHPEYSNEIRERIDELQISDK